MPSLKLFRRTWKYAEDDFVTSSILLAFFRAILFVGALLYSIFKPNIGDILERRSRVLLLCALVVCGLQIVVYIIIAIVSSRGGVMHVGGRRHLGKIVVIHLILLLLEFVAYVLSIVNIIRIYERETLGYIFSIMVKIIVWNVCNIFVILCETFNWCKNFDENGSTKLAYFNTFLYGKDAGLTDDEKRNLIQKMRELSRQKWTLYLRKKFTDFEEKDEDGKQEAIEEAAGAIVDVVTGLDLTLSDVIMGLMLLRWQTTQWLGGYSKVPFDYVDRQTDAVTNDVVARLENTQTLDPFQKLQINWLHISRLRRYGQFVKASYGWKFNIFERNCGSVPIYQICNKLSYRRSTASKHQMNFEEGINGPGGCFCAGKNAYLSAFMEICQLEPQNILVFDIADTFYNAAVMLVLDDRSQAIVLIIRGTVSGEDKLVDLLAMGEPLRDIDKTLGEDERFLGHAGMVRVSRNICNRMLSENWIEKARERRPTYPLVACGHSLGAGLVSLLSVLLRPRYPEIKAYAFSPPGSVMNEKLSEHTREFLCCVVYGYDMVGRLSASTIEDLRARLLHAVVVCDVPKYRFMGSRLVIAFLNILFPFCGLPKIGNMASLLSDEIKQKLIYPDLNDIYETEFGENFEENEQDVIGGVSAVDRLLPAERSLMNWKIPTVSKLLRLPRPYSKGLYSEGMLTPVNNHKVTVDRLLDTLKTPRCGSRVLHLIEVKWDSEIVDVRHMTNTKPPPIALWTDNRSFNTVLVHPKMLFNHSTNYLYAAIDRLYEAVTPLIEMRGHGPEIPSDESDESQDSKFCFVRKLKLSETELRPSPFTILIH